MGLNLGETPQSNEENLRDEVFILLKKYEKTGYTRGIELLRDLLKDLLG